MKINKVLIGLIVIALFVQFVYAADTIVKPGNFTINGDLNATNKLQGTIVCINNDCRTVWPSATDTNESTRVGNLALTDCPSGKLVIGVQDNGTVLCATSQDTQKSASGIYLFNDSTTISLNDTRLNLTIDDFVFGRTKLNSTIDNRAGDIKSVQGNDKFIINGSATGDVYLTLNTTHAQNNLNTNSSNYWDNLNSPSDIPGSQFWYNHTNTAIRESDKRYLNLSGSNANSNINIGLFNITANRIFGVQWTDIANKFIESVSSIYLFMEGTTLKFNDTQLNNTITNKASIFNETNYINQNFISKSNETNLNVNKSNFWDNLDTINQVKLDNLNDVNITNATAGKLLIFDGKNWSAGSVSLVDTNESIRVGNIALTDCPTGQIVQGVQDNGTVLCVSDTDTTNNLTIDQRINNSAINDLKDVNSSNATAGNLLSLNNGIWTAINRIIDTNESIRVSNIALTDCASNQKVLGLQENGTVLCGTDQDTIISDGSLNSSAWNKTGSNVFLSQPTNNVGIGDVSPSYSLDISGNFYTGKSASGSVVGTFENLGGATNDDGITIQIGPNTNPSTNNDFINFRDGDGTLLGQCQSDGGAGIECVPASDARRKKDIVNDTDIESDKLNKIRIVKFKAVDNGSDKVHTGLIAQELAEIYPELVTNIGSEDVENEPLMVSYIGFVPRLIKAFQEQNQKIKELEARITELEKK